ncbi:HU family DNA-binding protein [Hoylesella nanceiensis]|uniref:HU family DNA-binding protein n=1 Tax=Hoylesella nanceiensis TaxID=425941 RepID=UPI001CAFA337|nr:HU family DNA-binding protein [Hoylesella nanceiensis]MBF1427106.1 HU family DNA-binding protein [Hoylesella nanceiensis]
MSKNSFLIDMLTSKMGLEVAEAEAFITAMFKVVNEGLKEDKLVKIKGLGTFKLTKVSARESVDVNTGERIVIEGREKISFTPDNYMRDLVNSPFSQFETVVLSDGVDFSAIDEKYALNELEDDSSLLLSNEESLETIAEEPKNILSSIEEAKEALAQLNEKEEEGTVEEPVFTAELETENLLVVEQEESNEETKNQMSVPISLQLSPQQLSALNTKESVSDDEKKVEESEELSSVVENESSQIEEAPQFVIETEKIEEKEGPEPIEEESKEEEDTEESSSRSYVKPLLFAFLLIACLAIGAGVGYYFFQQQAKEMAVTQSPQTTNKVVVSAKKANNPIAVVDSSQKKQAAAMVDSITKKNTQAVVVKTEQPEVKDEKPVFDSKQYNKDPRVRTGAYIIIGVEKEIEVKAGQTLYSLSRRYLGPDMECYVEAINGKKEFKAGEKMKIPTLKLKKKKHRVHVEAEE